jgi:hypothetical protein
MSFDRRIRKLQEELTAVKFSLITNINAVHTETEVTRKKTLANIEAARCKFPSQLEDVKVWAEHRREIQNGASTVKLLNFCCSSSLSVFRRQFDTIAKHNCWTCQEKSTHLIIALQGRATDVRHGIPKSATYEEANSRIYQC